MIFVSNEDDLLAELEEACIIKDVQLRTNAALIEMIKAGSNNEYLSTMENVNQFIRFLSQYSTTARQFHNVYGKTDL